MKSLLFVLLLAMSAPIFASELDEVVAQLGDEDFDKREKASAKLYEYPEEYAKKFLEMSEKQDDPEMRHRLRLAAKTVYCRTTVLKSDEWLFLHGRIGVEGRVRCKYSIEISPEQNTRRWVAGDPWLVVESIDPQVIPDDRIMRWDVITEIKDVSINSLSVKAGTEYEITLRRYKNVEPLVHDNMDFDEKDFEEIKVKIKAGCTESKYIDWRLEEKIFNKQWDKFLQEYKDGHPEIYQRHGN